VVAAVQGPLPTAAARACRRCSSCLKVAADTASMEEMGCLLEAWLPKVLVGCVVVTWLELVQSVVVEASKHQMKAAETADRKGALGAAGVEATTFGAVQWET